MPSRGFDDIWGYLDKKLLGEGSILLAGVCLRRGGGFGQTQTRCRRIWGQGNGCVGRERAREAGCRNSAPGNNYFRGLEITF